MIKSIIVSILFIFSVGCANAQEKTERETDKKLSVGGFSDSSPVAGFTYRQRYPLTAASQKFVNDKGVGFSGLYGVRNFRAVLNGVYYRGGANNIYFNPKRDNRNPIPNQGLQNLCQEGFTHAVYLYSTNFESSPKEVRCKTFQGHDNVFTYSQISPLAYRDEDLRKLHGLIYERVRDPRLGPIYDHCWNGWHASGYVAATALRQFCDFSVDQAVAYWNLNTDGNNGSSYDKLRARIRSFVPNPDMTLSAEEKASLCPAPGSLEFSN